MPHSSDDPPSAPTASVEGETPDATVADAPDGANPAGPSVQEGDAQQPRRRRRRRRRRPPPAAASPGAALGDQTIPEETAPAGDTIPDTNADAQEDTAGDTQAPKPRRHRRRRRGPPREMSPQSLVSADVPANESGTPEPTTAGPVEDSTQAQPAPGMAGELSHPRRRRRRPPRRPGLTDQTGAASQSPSGPETITAGTPQSEPGTARRRLAGPSPQPAATRPCGTGWGSAPSRPAPAE